MPDIKHYQGREQGYIKHALIAKYLERFTIKIGSIWDEIRCPCSQPVPLSA